MTPTQTATATATPPIAGDINGCIYDEQTGKIIPDGQVSVSGPGSVVIIEDGSAGCYEFRVESKPGTYTVLFIPPDGYTAGTCAPAAPSFAPVGAPPPCNGTSQICELGTSANGGFLESAACPDNPFFFTFELENGDPVVLNNNLPLQRLRVPEVPAPTASPWGIAVLILVLGALGIFAVRRLELTLRYPPPSR
jgi:hypothetical protein